MNTESPVSFVEAVELAHDMALAESEYQEFGIVARALLATTYQTLRQRSTEQYTHPNNLSIRSNEEYIDDLMTAKKRYASLAKFFASRASFASDLVLSDAHGQDAPIFPYRFMRYTLDDPQLHILDSRKRTETLTAANIQLDPTHYSALLENLHEKHHAKQSFVVAHEKALQRQYDKNKRLKKNQELLKGGDSLDVTTNRVLARLTPSEQLLDSSHIYAFEKLEYLKTMTLMDGFVKKTQVPFVLREFIAKLAWNNLLAVAGEEMLTGAQGIPTIACSPGIILNSLGSLLSKYNGTVLSVSAMRLPVTEEWEQDYFAENVRDAMYEDSLKRVRSIAKLRPTGRHKEYVTLDAAYYVRRHAHTESPAIVITTRKSDALTAHALQESLVNESIAARRVVNDALSREVLSGLPSLGKRSR